MARKRKPKLPELAPPMLSDVELEAIVRACDGSPFADRRDTALVRLSVDRRAPNEVSG
jgi:hypothetical protein